MFATHPLIESTVLHEYSYSAEANHTSNGRQLAADPGLLKEQFPMHLVSPQCWPLAGGLCYENTGRQIGQASRMLRYVCSLNSCKEGKDKPYISTSAQHVAGWDILVTSPQQPRLWSCGPCRNIFSPVGIRNQLRRFSQGRVANRLQSGPARHERAFSRGTRLSMLGGFDPSYLSTRPTFGGGTVTPSHL